MTKKGFTAVEIIVIIAVLAFLFVFTVPKFMTLMHKAQEGSTKHQLMRVRSAIAAYYGENQGTYPTDDLSSLVPQYIEKIPETRLPGQAPCAHVSTGNFEAAFTKTGCWAYVNDPADPRFGDFFVNSDKEDSYGKAWYTH
ncbi:MAG: type II secretion system protein [Elusimicrobiaceae bacterium]|nr:type II secretion system protein [Elusimicrobiaceae bacterium]